MCGLKALFCSGDSIVLALILTEFFSGLDFLLNTVNDGVEPLLFGGKLVLDLLFPGLVGLLCRLFLGVICIFGGIFLLGI